MRKEKGITLVALVITIIVLIILAAVSIRAVMNDGIIINAKGAKESWEAGRTEEEGKIGSLLEKLEGKHIVSENGSTTLADATGTKLINYKIHGNTVDNTSVGEKTKNLWHTENTTFPVTISGVTVDYDENEQVYTFNGTSTGAGDVYICPNGKEIMNIKAGETYTMTTYQLGGNISGEWAHYGVRPLINNASWSNGMGAYPNQTISKTWEEDYQITKMYFYIYSVGITFDNVKIKVQLEKGNVATEYEPYGKYKIPVTVSGINLHNAKVFNYNEQTINGVTFTPLEDGTFYVKGKVEDTSKETSYKIEKEKAIPINAGVYRSKWHSEDLSILFGVTTTSGSGLNINSNGGGGTEVVETDGYVRYLKIYISAGTTREFDEIVYPQLSKGTTNYSYQQYVEPITTNIYLDEPLRKLGDKADYIDFKEQKVVRYIKEENGVLSELAQPEEEKITLPEIPTLKGITNITVDTTVMPSKIEVYYE